MTENNQNYPDYNEPVGYMHFSSALQKGEGSNNFSAFVPAENKWVKIVEKPFQGFSVVHEVATGRKLNYDESKKGYFYADENKSS